MEYIWLTIPVLMFAGMVRGYSGFGFAAIAIVGMNMVLQPQESVAIILAIDLLCSVSLWKTALKQADYPTLKKLVMGAILGIPLGYSLLLLLPSEILKLLICLFILLLSLLLFIEFKPFNTDKLSTKLGFGLASGIGTASASVGGPMIVYYMISSRLSTSAQRATMILFFIISESLSLLTLICGGMVSNSVPKAILILLIPTLIAVRYGQMRFQRHPPQSLKSFALPVIIIVSVLGIIKSSVTLLA